MSKEFEATGKMLEITDTEYDSDMAKAFTAGRALGRREMKGECKAAAKDQDFPDHIDCEGCRTARLIVNAIEAIPEEV